MVEPPADSAPFQLTFVTVAVPPETLRLPLHSWLIVTPLGSVHFTVQLLRALAPAATVTVAWKPPCQELTIAVLAVHPPDVEALGDALLGGALDGGTLDGGVLLGEALVGLTVEPPLVV